MAVLKAVEETMMLSCATDDKTLEMFSSALLHGPGQE